MSSIKKYQSYISRVCPLCESVEDEFIGTIFGKRQGRKFDHHIENQISICRKCGFVYSNPVIPQKEMDKYYQDMLTVYKSEEDYSINKRMTLIEKYKQNQGTIIEVGGNEQGVFKHTLQNIFEKYISADINDSADNSKKSIKEIKDVGNILVAYFVLEHIVDVDDFLKDCYKSLKPNGIFIIEVPDATRYYNEICGLNFIEHVNHFTPESLTKLMSKMGFELLEISRESVSRSFGFAGVYKKSSMKIEGSFYDKNAYVIMKSYLMEGMQRIERCKSTIKELVKELKPMMTRGGAFWCANEVLRSIIDMSNSDLTEYPLIIDQDVRKRDFYKEYKVETSEEAWKNGKLKKIQSLVICSENRVKSIVETLKENYIEVYKGIKIYYIDNNWNLHCYK